MLEPWQVVAIRPAFQNRWLNVVVETVRLPNEQTYEYTTIRRGKVAAGVVVLNEHNQLLLEQEYRHPVGQVIYQLPGGLADPGEAAETCVRRELLEETGLMAGELTYLGSFWNNPAISDGMCILYLCRDARPHGVATHDVAEFIAWDWHDLAWVKARIMDGTIKDRVVICAMAYLWMAEEGSRLPTWTS